MQTEEEKKRVETEFRRIVSTDLSKKSSGSWVSLFAIVLITILVVGGAAYYIKKGRPTEKKSTPAPVELKPILPSTQSKIVTTED